MKRFVLLGLGLLLATCAGLGPADAYTGTLSVENGGLQGTGNWFTNPQAAVIHWSVTQNGSLWHYEYTLNTPVGSVSHFIVELSPNLTVEEILSPKMQVGNTVYDWTNELAIDLWSQDGGNPNMPAPIWGLKFDEATSSGEPLTTVFSFDCARIPVWGDFYAKNGKAGGGEFNAIWNAGLTDPDPMLDASTPYTDPEVFGHILRPDTIRPGNYVPEFGALMLGSMGLLPVAIFRRLRR